MKSMEKRPKVETYPIDDILPRLKETALAHPSLVLQAPPGSGKTTLLNAIAGIPRYTIDGGRIVFKGKDITHMSMDERARMGIGMAFQRPPAIRGLKLKDLVKIVNPKADVEGILKKMDFEEFANRDVNRGFSGGEEFF